MRPALAAVATVQTGVVTCAQALQAGYSHDQIRTLVRRGRWVRVRHGAYVEGSRWRSADDRQRHLLAVRAGLLAVADDSMASHDSGAVVHELPSYGLDLSHVMLTRPPWRTSRREAKVGHQVAHVPPVQVVTVQGIRVTSPVRTALDVARLRGFDVGLVCADAALHAGASGTDLAEAAALMAEWPGGSTSTAVAAAADGRRESPGETLTSIVLASMGLDVEPQYVDAGLAYRVDFLLKGLGVVVEFDGRAKYVTADGRPDPRALWEEKKREDRIRERGYEFVRVYWEDLFGPRRLQLERRIVAAVARAASSRRLSA